MSAELPEIGSGMLVKYHSSWMGKGEFHWMYAIESTKRREVRGLKVRGDLPRVVTIVGDVTVVPDEIEELYAQQWGDEPPHGLLFDQVTGVLCNYPDWDSINTYAGIRRIWFRPPTQELTVDEISKRLGYPVKVVGNDAR